MFLKVPHRHNNNLSLRMNQIQLMRSVFRGATQAQCLSIDNPSLELRDIYIEDRQIDGWIHEQIQIDRQIVILFDQKKNSVILYKGIPNNKSDDYTYKKPCKFKGHTYQLYFSKLQNVTLYQHYIDDI